MIKQELDQTYQNAVTLAKAAELATHIVKHVAGNAVSTSINSSVVSAQSIEMLVLAGLQKRLKIATV